eukprot:825258-Rhodomonas_salina.2
MTRARRVSGVEAVFRLLHVAGGSDPDLHARLSAAPCPRTPVSARHALHPPTRKAERTSEPHAGSRRGTPRGTLQSSMR